MDARNFRFLFLKSSFFFFDLRKRLVLTSNDAKGWKSLESRDTERERERESSRKEKGRREWMDEGERLDHGERACAISSVRAHGSLTKPMRPC